MIPALEQGAQADVHALEHGIVALCIVQMPEAPLLELVPLVDVEVVQPEQRGRLVRVEPLDGSGRKLRAGRNRVARAPADDVMGRNTLALRKTEERIAQTQLLEVLGHDVGGDELTWQPGASERQRNRFAT